MASHIAAMWEAKTERRTEFVYLLRWPDEQTKIDAWAAFMADQEWEDIKRATRDRDRLVGEIEDRLLVLTDCSPASAPEGLPGVGVASNVDLLFVPGAWLGGWCWRDVAARLRASGHTVLCPTLTGLGERAHLLGPQISLETHVTDIVSLLHYRDLSGVALVGHSYGGTIITAVAEQVPDRIGCLVYLDASVPLDGESNNDVIGTEMASQLRAAAVSGGDGWRVPPAPYVVARLSDPTLRSWVEARLTSHPLRPFDEPVRLRSREAAALRRAFIRSTQSDLYDRLINRAREAGWHCREISGGHYAMLTQPEAVASALSEVPL